MSTVEKALKLLGLFSESRTNLGITEMSRLMGWDKSNVKRYAADLAASGFLHQNPHDKSYHLGSALTRLAIVRERSMPIAGETKRVLERLVETTGETAHLSSFLGDTLLTTELVETQVKGTRVYIDPSEPLPFHASASGIAFLAASKPEFVSKTLSGELQRFTQETVTDKAGILAQLETTRHSGYACVTRAFDYDVIGIAAAVLSFDGDPVGSVAVATPAGRMNATIEQDIAAEVTKAAKEISAFYGA